MYICMYVCFFGCSLVYISEAVCLILAKIVYFLSFFFISPGNTAEITLEAADIALRGDRLAGVAIALGVSHATLRTIHRNLLFSISM